MSAAQVFGDGAARVGRCASCRWSRGAADLRPGRLLCEAPGMPADSAWREVRETWRCQAYEYEPGAAE